jgi:hypothetical protein
MVNLLLYIFILFIYPLTILGGLNNEFLKGVERENMEKKKFKHYVFISFSIQNVLFLFVLLFSILFHKINLAERVDNKFSRTPILPDGEN